MDRDDFDTPQKEKEEGQAVIQDQQKFDYFSKQFVQALDLVIQDVSPQAKEVESFFDTLSDSFNQILRLSSSVTQFKGPATYLLRNFVESLHRLIDQMSESIVMQEDPDSVASGELQTKILSSKRDLLFRVARCFAVSLKNVLNKSSLTHHSAHLIINFVIRVLSPKNVPPHKTCPVLNLQLTQVAASLFYLGNNKHYFTDLNLLYAFASNGENFDLNAFSEGLTQGKDFNASSIFMLGLISAHESQITIVYSYLVEQCGKFAFNDKNKEATIHQIYFDPFYKALTEKQFKDGVLPSINFAMNRSGVMIPNITYLLKKISFKISNELASALTIAILTKDYMVQFNDEVEDLLDSIIDKLQAPAEFSQTLLAYLSSQFDKVKLQASITQIDKLKILRLICSASNKFNTDSESLVATTVDFFFGLKEQTPIPTSLSALLSRSNSASKLIESQIQKVQFSSQIQNLVELKFLNHGAVVLYLLIGKNFEIAANQSLILSMMRYVCESGQGSKLLENDLTNKYLLSPTSILNVASNFRKMTEKDVVNHLRVIQILLSTDVKAQWSETLTTVLIEYLVNPEYVFRGAALWNAFNLLRNRWSEANLVVLLKQVFARISKENTEPAAETEIKQSASLDKKIRNFLQVVVPKDIKLETETFIAVVQLISHPKVSKNVTVLKQNASYLTKNCKIPCDELFATHSQSLINTFLKDRTGILNPNMIVRQVAINILILVSWAGLLQDLIPQMMPIFNYKPVETLDRLETLFTNEFDRISHYDLLFYSEMTKDMMQMYREQDEKASKQVLCEKNKETKTAEESKEAEVTIGASDDMDPALLAMLSKATKGKKSKGKAPPAKPAPKQEQAQAKVEAVPEITKEERNKQDRAQMLNYISEMRNLKARQIRCCYQVLRAANMSDRSESLNYQDIIFQHLTLPLLKLLKLSATKFDSVYFLQNILNEAQYSTFFKMKGSLLIGFLAISDNKLSSKAISEITSCLHKLDQGANFTEMGVGSLQVCLTISNFVLKDPSVNLSVKEVGLSVAQSILMENSSVKLIDLVRLTVNMLKTNYISNNLSGFLRRLIRRTSRVEIALLLQPLFEYQPVPRKVLLNEILQYDEPLFCPVWFSAQMWILLFDEELGSLSRKIFNKFGLTLRSEALELEHEKSTQNIFHFLRDKNFGIFSLASKAVSSAMELMRTSPRLNKLIDDLIKFYATEWDEIEIEATKVIEADYTKNQDMQRELIADYRTNRIAIPQIFCRAAKLLQPQHFERVLNFLISEACLDRNVEIKDSASKAAVALIKNQGQEHANTILTVLETILNLPDKDQKLDKIKNQAVILLGHLAQFLGDTAQKKLLTAFEKLMDLMLDASLVLQQSICKCIPQLTKFFPEKAKVYFAANLKQLRESKDEKSVRVSAFATAGLLKGLGMTFMVESDIIGLITKESFDSKKTESIRKQAGLYLFESLAYSMGKSFEVFLAQVFPLVLSSISDQKEQVRNAALGGLQIIMAMFSNFAIKQALPQFLNELKNDNWRSKFSTVEALGNMAFCAPKQISSFLPQIVKALREVLNDTHEKVHEAAIEAIKKIGSVIKCPEIGDMLEIIVKALSNTNMYLNEALNLMLETSFAHSIDAPSLSLLVPLLDAGLTMHDNTSKQMAAQLMGNICSLTQDPHDLIPYMPILVPAIKQSLFDAIPEIRASAAKALGKLSKGLGTAHCEEMIGWLTKHIDLVQTSSSEKSGAAQGFAEMISSHGIDYFNKYIQIVIAKAQDKETHLREAYRGVLVFLPGCFDKYVDYLPMLVPVMIQGLSDDIDEVRKVSMRNVKICIKQFARSSPYQLVLPVMRMMFSTDFRVRESSSILMFQLVKELENDVIRAQPKYIDNDTKQKILASMFILKYDPIEKVFTQAGVIWKSLIDTPLIVLRQIIDTCIQIIFQIIQSPSQELQEMGLSCIRGIVEKMGEKLVIRAIEIFENLLEKVTEKTQSVGICKVIFNMAGAASHRLLQIISPKLVQIMDPYLSAESEELREWSSRVFIVLLQRQPEKAFVDPILEMSILQKLKQLTRDNNEVEAQRLIKTLQYLVEKAPDLKIENRMLVLCDINDKKALFSIAQARIIRALASTFAAKVFTSRFYYQVLIALQEELNAPVIDDFERIQFVLMAYAELLSHIPDQEAMQTNDEITKFYQSCQENKRPGLYLDLVAHYCTQTKTNFEKLAEIYLENSLKYMNFPDEKLVAKVVAAMNAIMEVIPKENQMLLVQLIRRQIEINGVQIVNTMHSLQKEEGSRIEHLYKKKVPVLMIFKNALGVTSIVNYVQAAIMHGQVQVRADAAFTFKYILDFAEPAAIRKEIVKICGALIRVVNDKFPQDLKLQIFLALKLIQSKFADAAKPMTPQLQTTFLKALGDSQSTVHVQQIVIENLILLCKGLTRVDPIIKELVVLIDGSKIDGQQKQLVSECLALVIRAKGKQITPAMSEQVVTQLGELLQNGQDFNDVVLLNSSVALAYLSAYAEDAKQMVTLFNAFPGMTPVSIGLKFGVLTNGNETIDKKSMASTLQVLLVDWLARCSGFDEVNSSTQTDDDVFRFKGAFELLGHLLNAFGRREWCQAANSPYIALIFGAVNQAQILKTLQNKKDISAESFFLLVSVLSQIPIKADKMQPELAEITQDGFLAIQKFYLEHGDLNQRCTDAILNLLQLNYDNFLDLSTIRSYDRQAVKEATLTKNLEGVIPEDMRMYAVEIVFRKK